MRHRVSVHSLCGVVRRQPATSLPREPSDLSRRCVLVLAVQSPRPGLGWKIAASGYTVKRSLSRLSALFLVFPFGSFIAAACADSQAPSTEPRLEGTYTSTTFAFATPDTVFDLLEEGDSITITLHVDGTTSGSLVGPDVPISLAGQWDTADAALHLHFQNPIVFNRISFAITPNQLVGDLPLPPNRLTLTLTKLSTQ